MNSWKLSQEGRQRSIFEPGSKSSIVWRRLKSKGWNRPTSQEPHFGGWLASYKSIGPRQPTYWSELASLDAGRDRLTQSSYEQSGSTGRVSRPRESARNSDTAQRRSDSNYWLRVCEFAGRTTG